MGHHPHTGGRMGQRGEVFSTRIFAEEGKKTYFFNVKENRFGDLYLNVVESRKTPEGSFKRSSLVVFGEDLDGFLEMLDASVADFRGRRPFDREFPVSDGRRVYAVRPAKGRPAMEISESREDSTGSHRESVRVAPGAVDVFLDGLGKAVARLRQA